MHKGLFFTCTVLFTLIAGCTSTSSNVDPALQGLTTVKNTHVLRAAYINYPPSMTVDPNTKAKTGIMPDVIGEIGFFRSTGRRSASTTVGPT